MSVDDSKLPLILKELDVADSDRVLNTVERESQWMFKDSEHAPSSFFFKDPVYLHWLNVASSKLLWIGGDQDREKTTFAASLIRSLQPKMQGEEPSTGALLSYAFCNDEVRSTVDLLKALLYQIVFNKRDLAAHLQIRDDKRKKDQSSTSIIVEDVPALWQSLQNMCNSSTFDTAYFVVDGLDNLDIQSRKELFDLLQELMKIRPVANDLMSPTDGEVSQSCNIKWLLVGRPRDDIESFTRQFLVIDMEDDEHRSRVEQAVDDKFSKVVEEISRRQKYPVALTYMIKTYFKSKSQRDEVWIKLASEELERRNLPHHQIRKFLENLPPGAGMFDYISNQVLNSQHQGIETTKEIFRALVLAYEPPNLEELTVLVGDSRVNEETLALCAPFVAISNGSVDFAHTKIRDLFENSANRIHKILFPVESSVRLQHGLMALRYFE